MLISKSDAKAIISQYTKGNGEHRLPVSNTKSLKNIKILADNAFPITADTFKAQSTRDEYIKVAKELYNNIRDFYNYYIVGDGLDDFSASGNYQKFDNYFVVALLIADNVITRDRITAIISEYDEDNPLLDEELYNSEMDDLRSYVGSVSSQFIYNFYEPYYKTGLDPSGVETIYDVVELFDVEFKDFDDVMENPVKQIVTIDDGMRVVSYLLMLNLKINEFVFYGTNPSFIDDDYSKIGALFDDSLEGGQNGLFKYRIAKYVGERYGTIANDYVGDKTFTKYTSSTYDKLGILTDAEMEYIKNVKNSRDATILFLNTSRDVMSLLHKYAPVNTASEGPQLAPIEPGPQ